MSVRKYQKSSTNAEKRVLAIVFGNTNDLNSLVTMLHQEEDEDVLLQVIRSIGGMANPQALIHLEKIAPTVTNQTIRLAIDQAKNLITRFAVYEDYY